jgi:hypothetical protein
MKVINDLELVLIELEYSAADCLYRKISTSDPSEQANSKALLPKLKTARLAVRFALDSMRSPPEREVLRAA